MKNQLVKYSGDPIATALIKAGRFETTKYELVHSKKWSQEFTKLFPASISEAIELNTPSIATVKKYRGEKPAYLLLSAIILQTAAAFNIGKKMTETQVYITARHIYQKYYFLTVADFRLCFNNAIAGEYGVIYDRLDTNILMEWLRQYNEQRLQVAQFHAQQSHEQNKKAKATDPDPDGLRKIAEMGAKVLEKARAEKESGAEKAPEEGGNLNCMIALEAICRKYWDGVSGYIHPVLQEMTERNYKNIDFEMFYKYCAKEVLEEIAAGLVFSEAVKKVLG